MDNNLCKIHNEPALFYEQYAQQNIVQLCRFCIQQRLDIHQNIDDVDNLQKQAFEQLQLKYDQSIKQLKDFDEKLEQFTQKIQQKLKKLKQQVEHNIQDLIEKKSQQKNNNNDFKSINLNLINEEENTYNNQLTQIKQLLNNQLKELEISTKFDQLYQSLNNISINVNNKENQQKVEVFNKKFDYQLMKQSSYKQKEYCHTIAFNKDATIVIAGSNHQIKVFDFKANVLRETQLLNGHSDQVFCLYFMKKSNQFISGSVDSTMIIWEYNKDFQWQCHQVLKGHADKIWCILMNQNEDLMISGSADKAIKFWQKQNNIWACSQSIDCQSEVYSSSLNNQENILITSVRDDKIFVIKLQGKEWMIKQKIQVEQQGFRVCYINQNQFVFQPCDRQYLQIYDYDNKDQTYKIRQELSYSNKAHDDNCLFPIRQITQTGLIIVKNDYHIHLIKRNSNCEYIVEQSINFGTNLLFGSITDDGRYIATWDSKSKEIQIRKFEL